MLKAFLGKSRTGRRKKEFGVKGVANIIADNEIWHFSLLSRSIHWQNLLDDKTQLYLDNVWRDEYRCVLIWCPLERLYAKNKMKDGMEATVDKMVLQ